MKNEILHTERGMFRFLNSRLGVWLLGIMFLSILPYIIKVTHLSYESEVRRSRQQQMLATEIGHRMRYIEYFKRPMRPDQLNDALFAFYGLDDTLIKIRHWRYYNFKPIYEEYTKVSIINLIVEYAHLQKKKDRTREIMRRAHMLEDLKNDYLIADFNDALVRVNNMPHYDLRVLNRDTSLLRMEYIQPLAEWWRTKQND